MRHRVNHWSVAVSVLLWLTALCYYILLCLYVCVLVLLSVCVSIKCTLLLCLTVSAVHQHSWWLRSMPTQSLVYHDECCPFPSTFHFSRIAGFFCSWSVVSRPLSAFPSFSFITEVVDIFACLVRSVLQSQTNHIVCVAVDEWVYRVDHQSWYKKQRVVVMWKTSDIQGGA